MKLDVLYTVCQFVRLWYLIAAAPVLKWQLNLSGDTAASNYFHVRNQQVEKLDKDVYTDFVWAAYCAALMQVTT